MLALLSHTNPPGSDGEDSGLPSSIFQKPGLHLLAVLAMHFFNSLSTRLAMGSATVSWLMNTQPRQCRESMMR